MVVYILRYAFHYSCLKGSHGSPIQYSYISGVRTKQSTKPLTLPRYWGIILLLPPLLEGHELYNTLLISLMVPQSCMHILCVLTKTLSTIVIYISWQVAPRLIFYVLYNAAIKHSSSTPQASILQDCSYSKRLYFKRTLCEYSVTPGQMSYTTLQFLTCAAKGTTFLTNVCIQWL